VRVYSEVLDDERQAARHLLASVRRGSVQRARDVALVQALDQAETALAAAVAALGAASRRADALPRCCTSTTACVVHV
jgi:hypothetical protein